MRVDHDTIAAIATPPGRGGVAIIRVSGNNVQAVLSQLTNKKLAPRQATFTAFHSADNEILDQGIALYFAAPHSFTGEDVLEIHAHGSPILLDVLLERVLQIGARLARPGEFSERAFLNGKLDLAQAEAVLDLINAATRQAALSAVRSLQGDFSQQITQLVQALIQLRVYLEAQIDFAEEEIDILTYASLQTKSQQVIDQLEHILKVAQQGSVLREGFTAIILGKPNVGKSSLLNCLSGKALAIVTDIPGTTRDLLRDFITIDGIPMHLIDTAGLRESQDLIEQEGIRRAQVEADKADVILYLTTAADADKVNRVTDLGFATKKIIHVINKIDLTNQLPKMIQDQDKVQLYISVKEQLGINLLIDAIKLKLGINSQPEGLFLARRRHIQALQTALDFAQQGLVQLQQGAIDLAADDMRLAQQALQTITGEYTSDDLLGEIFSQFCIGK